MNSNTARLKTRTRLLSAKSTKDRIICACSSECFKLDRFCRGDEWLRHQLVHEWSLRAATAMWCATPGPRWRSAGRKALTTRLPVSAENRLRLRERPTLHTRQRSLTRRGERQEERAKRRFPSVRRPGWGLRRRERICKSELMAEKIQMKGSGQEVH